ncbi:hypothetical protein [Nonomuraea basaltis]|uniref:hypothetical protein n=1 Tax=Nonomuraea basaltis TaxID=2495887 RepID=UPI00110C4F72|nr:hypothetical protein [Nonomuraea basaltis]TMS00282.1 hypothetical protein EJK15_02525 [Nonomuraea basaltis]
MRYFVLCGRGPVRCVLEVWESGRSKGRTELPGIDPDKDFVLAPAAALDRRVRWKALDERHALAGFPVRSAAA